MSAPEPTVGRRRLLERGRERETLAAAVRAAAGGQGSLVLVQGPPGIGKTRLLAEADGLCREQGLRRLTARGTELERDFPFGGVRQLLEPALRATPDGGTRAQLQGAAEVAASALFDPSRSSWIAADRSDAVLYGLYWLAADLARQSPLVLCVDDAHWLDAPSLRWLRYLANRVEAVPIALLVAMRPFEPGSHDDLVGQLAETAGAAVLTPQALSPAAVGAIAEEEYGGGCDPAFVAALAEASGGNPFYLHELVRMLADAGVQPVAANVERVAEAAPPTVAQTIRRRLRRLPAGCESLAGALAVLGETTHPGLAARLAELDARAAADAYEALVRSDFLQSDGQRFTHPLVRAAVYDQLSPPQRDRLHRLAAQLLAQGGADAGRVALQLLACEPRGDPWARDQLRQAARDASGSGAPDVAATYLRRSLAEGASADERIAILRELGEAELAAHGPSGFDFLRQALDEAPDAQLRAEICLQLGRGLSSQGLHGEATASFARGLRETADRDTPLAAELTEQMALTALVDLRALKELGGLGGVADLVGALPEYGRRSRCVLGWILVAGQPPATLGADILEDALAGGLTVADETAYSAVGAGLMAAGRLDRARLAWDQAVAAARAEGNLTALRLSLTLRAHVLVRGGHLDQAESDLRSLIDWVAAIGYPLSRLRLSIPWVLCPLLDVLVERGELEEAQNWLALSGLEADTPELHGWNYLLCSMGRLRIAQGRAAEAVMLLRECGRRQEEWGIRNPGFMPWRGTLATALALCGDAERALEACREEEELARSFGVPRELGIALRASGLILKGTAGVERLREAVAVLAGTPARLEHARALVDLGSLLRARGVRTEARDPLREGLDLATRCGARALARRAREELVATGAKPRRTAVSGVEALTAAERRVAQLAAEGPSNREIAEALFVTEKTVEGHLSHVYRKLAISSRSQLTTALGSSSPQHPGELRGTPSPPAPTVRLH